MALLFLLRRYADEAAGRYRLVFFFYLLFFLGGGGEPMAMFYKWKYLWFEYLCQNNHLANLINPNELQCNDKLEKELIWEKI